MRKTKKQGKMRILAILCTFCMVCTILPMPVFATSPQESPELVITNTTRDFANSAIVGDTLTVTKKPDWANDSEILWYNSDFGYSNATATPLNQTGGSSTAQYEAKNYQYCTVTNPDSKEILYSNIIYVSENKAFLPAEQLKVGQVIPANAPMGIGGMASQGYKYMVVYDDVVGNFDHYSVIAFTPTWSVDKETVVTKIEAFPSEIGGWPEDTRLPNGQSIKGQSTYMVLTVPYVPHNVTHTLKNIIATPNTTGEAKAAHRVNYNTTLTANAGYALPENIEVSIDGNTITSGTDYTYNAKTGEVVVFGDKILGDITLTATADVIVKPAVVLPPVIGNNAPNTKLDSDSQVVLDAALSEADKQAIANGANYSIHLKVDKHTPSAEDKAKMESTLGKNKMGMFLDISLIKNVNGMESKIENLNGKIRIIIDIPADLLKDGRTFSALRLHNGSTEILNDLDTNPNTITIETDKFSTYALAYMDKDTQMPTNPVDNDDKTSPQTGDNTSILPTVLLAFTSLGAIFTLMKKRKMM